MNFQMLDWVVLLVLVVAINLIAMLCTRYVKSVAGFLVAGSSLRDDNFTKSSYL